MKSQDQWDEILTDGGQELRVARPIGEFAQVVERMERLLPIELLLRGNKGKPWREAWIALKFARATEATHLGLAAQGAPNDFVLRRADEEWLEYQATEALLDGRKRDEEVNASVPGQVREVEHPQIRRQSEGALPSLMRALEKKTRTSAGGRLVIYWNTGWLIDAHAFVHDLRAQSERYRHKFAEAWIMGKGSLFRVAPHFEIMRGSPTSFGTKRAGGVSALDEFCSDI